MAKKVKITKTKEGTVVYTTGGGIMGALKSIGRSISGFFSRATKGNFFSWLGTREVIPEINSDKAIHEGFNASTWVYAIIAKNAKKFGSIPRYLYDQDKLLQEKQSKRSYRIKENNSTKLFDSDLNRLLNRPNPYQGRAQFLATVYAFYLACAEGFIWLNRGDVAERYDSQSGKFIPRSDAEIDVMPVLEMYALPSNCIKVISDPDNLFGITGYYLEAGGIKMPLRKNDVIHWKDLQLKFDPSTGEHLRGMTRLTPGASTLQENKDITSSSVRFHQNDGAKGLLHTKSGQDDLSPEQESDLRSVVDAKINNGDVKGMVATLFGVEWNYIDLAVSAVDRSLVESKIKNQQELCALFDTPHLLFVPTDSTFANLDNAKRNWLHDTIIPATKELDEELNRVLLKSFKLEGRAVIMSDFSELPELQEDEAKKVDSLLKAYWITPNQKLIAQGYEAIDNELFNEPWVPDGLSPLSERNGDGFDEQYEELKSKGLNY